MLIDKCNIPDGGPGTEAAYKAIKMQFEAMAALISTGEISTASQISDYVWSVINEATEILEE